MKVMIVDDEVIIRNGLSTVIKWEELGFRLLPPAASAEEALARFPEEQPNIVLTDIRMTGMDGLALSAEMKRLLPDTEIIILTGYDSFSYAQQALRDGVNDYLLKTSRPEEIIMAAMKAKQRLLERWASRRQESMGRSAFRDSLLERLLTEERPSAAAESVSELLPGLRPDAGAYQVMIAAASGWGSAPADRSLAQFAVANMTQELIPCETLLRKDHVLIVLSRPNDGCRTEQVEAELTRISRKLKCRLFAAAGSCVASLQGLRQSHAEAAFAFAFRWIAGEEALIPYDRVAGRKGGRAFCTQEGEARLIAMLKTGSVIELRRWVDEAIGAQLADPEVTPDSLQAYIHSVVLSGQRWVERMMQALGEDASADEQLRHEPPDRDGRPQEALFGRLQSVMELYREFLSGERVSYIKRAVAYIQTNLDKSLTLQQVAKHVHLNPSHFSEVFKRETGWTYIDFVTRERIARAKAMLEQSPAKISEIAGSVGYEDVKYFSQLFKKLTGQTPSEYRQKPDGSPPSS
ncbi:response regulator transcription factor [Cohnella nanjingensis]|uniref:Response regulator n=1 Tax=Cohnella nanjingensis TaxID=1387779 RepID=A0A7X0RVF0_9BACL|nr:response regulator [Cohnella nanjingensis]MBB6673095.1 response regulator [Cohnella nanjingensis]